MTMSDLPHPKPSSVQEDALDEMSEGNFVAAWTAIVGEPPAIMLDRRADMVRVLVESVPVATSDRADPSVADQPETEAPKP